MDVLVYYGVMKEDALKPEQFFLPLKALSLLSEWLLRSSKLSYFYWRRDTDWHPAKSGAKACPSLYYIEVVLLSSYDMM